MSSSSSSISEDYTIFDKIWQLDEVEFQVLMTRLAAHGITEFQGIDNHLDGGSSVLPVSLKKTREEDDGTNQEQEATTESCPPRKRARVVTDVAPAIQNDNVGGDVTHLIQEAIPAMMDSLFFTPQEFGRFILLTCKRYANNLEGGKSHIYQRLLESVDTDDVPKSIRKRMGDKWLLEQLVVKNEPIEYCADKQLLVDISKSKHSQWEDLTMTLSIWKNKTTKLCSITLEGMELGLVLTDMDHNDPMALQVSEQDDDDVTFSETDTLQVRGCLYRNRSNTIDSCSIIQGLLEKFNLTRLSMWANSELDLEGLDPRTDILYKCNGPKLAMTDAWEDSASRCSSVIQTSTSLISQSFAPLSFCVNLVSNKLTEEGRHNCQKIVGVQVYSPFERAEGAPSFLQALDHLKGWSTI